MAQDEVTYQIYGLRSQDSDMYRYIGFTSAPLERRLTNHLCDKTKCRRVNWFKSLEERPIIELIEDGIQKADVCKKEIFYIKFFKSIGARLVNGTGGGDGMMRMSDETRKKISDAAKGRPSKRKGIKTGKQSPETILKRSMSMRGKKRIITDEWRANMSKGQIKHSVIQYNLDGTIVKEWVSTVEAEREGGFDNGQISAVCIGKRITHKGFKWAYNYGKR